MTRASLTLSLALAAGGLVPGSRPALADEHLLTAADVVDRDTLKDFVLGARDLLDATGSDEELQAVLADLRTERWREGSIYIFITGYDGTSFFHGANPAREGTNNYDQEDANGVKIIQELIKAAQAGGGFVDYLFDNPAIEGADESPKVSYAAPIEIQGASYYIGAGSYPADAGTHVAPASWGVLKAPHRSES